MQPNQDLYLVVKHSLSYVTAGLSLRHILRTPFRASSPSTICSSTVAEAINFGEELTKALL